MSRLQEDLEKKDEEKRLLHDRVRKMEGETAAIVQRCSRDSEGARADAAR